GQARRGLGQLFGNDAAYEGRSVGKQALDDGEDNGVRAKQRRHGSTNSPQAAAGRGENDQLSLVQRLRQLSRSGHVIGERHPRQPGCVFAPDLEILRRTLGTKPETYLMAAAGQGNGQGGAPLAGWYDGHLYCHVVNSAGTLQHSVCRQLYLIVHVAGPSRETGWYGNRPSCTAERRSAKATRINATSLSVNR